MKRVLILSIVFSGVVLLISGCARNISSSTYDAQTLGSADNVYECVVVSTRRVQVEEGDYLENNKTGALMGAVAGGAVGQAFGGGRGRILTTAGGALLGGAAGAVAEKALKSQEGLEYVVRLNSGQLKTVVQGLDSALQPGQAALLIVNDKGRSRVVPRFNNQ
jgi:outer membrane lipoprotein SlyB